MPWRGDPSQVLQNLYFDEPEEEQLTKKKLHKINQTCLPLGIHCGITVAMCLNSFVSQVRFLALWGCAVTRPCGVHVPINNKLTTRQLDFTGHSCGTCQKMLIQC